MLNFCETVVVGRKCRVKADVNTFCIVFTIQISFFEITPWLRDGLQESSSEPYNKIVGCSGNLDECIVWKGPLSELQFARARKGAASIAFKINVSNYSLTIHLKIILSRKKDLTKISSNLVKNLQNFIVIKTKIPSLILC